jgi:hypothetical protein
MLLSSPGDSSEVINIQLSGGNHHKVINLSLPGKEELFNDDNIITTGGIILR